MIDVISGAARQLAPRGAKILLLGPTGVGKTSQLRTLDAANTLFVDIEAGDLSVQDVAIDTMHVESWPQACELAHSITNGALDSRAGRKPVS
jgi:ABC-type arginine transport system ATPase subunit